MFRVVALFHPMYTGWKSVLQHVRSWMLTLWLRGKEKKTARSNNTNVSHSERRTDRSSDETVRLIARPPKRWKNRKIISLD